MIGLQRMLALILSITILLAFFPKNTYAFTNVSASSAILIEQKSGRVLYAKQAHDKRRIASITKIMTAILAIESGKLDEKTTVSKNAVYTEGSSIYLQEGEKIKLEDLVYGLMLRSGNDSAVAIAEHIGGSLEGFVFLMNQKAEQIGMTNTEFANPHGLDDHENHYSTAYDMALLTRYAMQNKKYREIASTKVYRAPNPNEKWDRVWKNKNKLLTGLYKYCTGGKTGYTKRAKRTLVSTASKDGVDLIAVTLNGPDDWNDHIQMFNWGFDNYKVVKLVNKGPIDGIENEFYENNVVTLRDFYYPLTDKERSDIHINIKLVKPNENWKEDDIPFPVGRMYIILGDENIGALPIVYDKNSIESSAPWFSVIKQLFLSIFGVRFHG